MDTGNDIAITVSNTKVLWSVVCCCCCCCCCCCRCVLCVFVVCVVCVCCVFVVCSLCVCCVCLLCGCCCFVCCSGAVVGVWLLLHRLVWTRNWHKGTAATQPSNPKVLHRTPNGIKKSLLKIDTSTGNLKTTSRIVLPTAICPDVADGPPLLKPDHQNPNNLVGSRAHNDRQGRHPKPSPKTCQPTKQETQPTGRAHQQY